VVHIVVTGKIAKKMAKVLKYLTPAGSMMVSGKRMRSMDLVFRRGLVEISTKEVILKVICTAMVITFGLTRVNTKVITSTIKNMAVVFTSLAMVGPTKVLIKMTKGKAMEPLNGQMVVPMKVIM
jgi:hypothetical protein